MSDYVEEIGRLRQEAAERQVRLQEETAKATLGDIEEYQKSAADALESGDRETASLYAEYINEAEARLQQELAALPAPGMSEAKADWVARRQDLARHPDAAKTADIAHNYITGNMGVRDDSPEYFELMQHALEPPGYEPQPSADDIVEILNKTSRYGADLTAKEYNKGVRKLIEAKKHGGYPDR